MTKLKEPNKIIKRRYDVCIFNKNSGDVILYKKSNFRQWYADPFLASEGGKTYCFVELMDNHVKRGQIAVIDLAGGVTPVITEPYHLSFPNLFHHGSSWFMMPETSGDNSLHLYKADSFPYKWSFHKTLMEGIKVCDSVFFSLDGKEYLYTYEFASSTPRALIYEFDWDALEVGRMVGEIPDPKKLLRPAGKAIYHDGMAILPTQKGTYTYGEDVIFRRITRQGDSFFLEEAPFQTHYPEDIVSRYDHKHTYNSSGDSAVLDFSKLVFSPLQLLDGLPCTLRRVLRKKQG